MKRFLVVMVCCAIVATACARDNTDRGAATPTRTGRNGTNASFGDLTDVCRPGTPSGSPTIGVTPTEVRIATFADAGYAGRPGLNQEFFDTADVFARWCNDRGGINGRHIVVDHRDAAVTNVRARMEESCANDFVMVGGGAVFDQDGVETRLKCLLPDFAGLTLSNQARGADLLVQPMPNPTTELHIGILNYLGAKFPAATEHVGILTADLATTKTVADQTDQAAKALGWKVAVDDAYPAAGVTDWTPYAQKLKDAGVRGLVWIGEPENLAALLSALHDIRYRLDFIRVDPNNYDQNLIKTAGALLADRNVYITGAFVPFEGAGKHTATGQYLQAFAHYQPTGKSRTYLGVQAWSAWLLFAKSALSCGNQLTRTCVYNAARKIKAWTGGGLHAQSSPAANKTVNCTLIMRTTPAGFVRATDTHPNVGIYQCSPKNIYALPANASDLTTLAEVGQSMTNLK